MKRDLTEEQLRQEVTVVLPLSVVLRIGAEPAIAGDRQPAISIQDGHALPPVGDDYQGGKFAGVTLDKNELAALVLLPEEFNGTHEDALKWASARDAVLPSRHDGIVLFEKLKSEFRDAWYWLEPQHAGEPVCAWCQGFISGNQGWLRRNYSYRARAGRRFPIR